MPRKSRKNVGLIGLGIIGSRVAAGLRASGFQTFVWNRTAKPTPNFVGSPAEVAELCEIIQLFVADAQALFDVIEQMKDALTPQHVVICNATVGPEATIEAARVVEETGAHFLDAPFTGSKGAAEKRSLVYYIGGDEATFLRARPVLEATSKAIVRIGGVGHAATLKVVTNMIAAVSIQTLGEALAIVQKAGLDPEVLAAALEQNACRSATMDLKLPKMIAGDYEAHFSLKHMFKDVQLGIHIANALDIEIPATTVTAGVMYGALNQGWGDLDYAALYKIYEPQAAGGATAAELQSGFAQIEDLDAKEAHYRETTVPAPPRPGSEPAATAEEPPVVLAPAPEVPKVAVPTLAAVLSPPEEARRREPESGASAEGAEAILLAPIDSPADRPPDAIILERKEGANEPPKLGIVEGTAAVVETPPAPGPAEVKAESAAADREPEHAKVVEFVPPTESAREAESKPAAAVGENHSPESKNGNVDDVTEATVKPFNFVKRWFVSRTGG
jgi:3-hydroxyisobutyrate dehydrogenase-like beta-hydroxyacid dehydrogenase